MRATPHSRPGQPGPFGRLYHTSSISRFRKVLPIVTCFLGRSRGLPRFWWDIRAVTRRFVTPVTPSLKLASYWNITLNTETPKEVGRNR